MGSEHEGTAGLRQNGNGEDTTSRQARDEYERAHQGSEVAWSDHMHIASFTTITSELWGLKLELHICHQYEA